MERTLVGFTVGGDAAARYKAVLPPPGGPQGWNDGDWRVWLMTVDADYMLDATDAAGNDLVVRLRHIDRAWEILV